MLRLTPSRVLGLASGLILFSGYAAATSITNTNFNNWKETITGSPTEANFSFSYTTYNTSQGITLNAIGNSSVSFVVTGPDNSTYKLTGTSFNGTNALEGSTDSGAGINIAMPTGGENAMLFGLGDTISGSTLTLAFSDGESFQVSTPSNSTSYLFGISISHPVSSVLITSSSGAPVLDDFWYGVSNLTQDSGGSSQQDTTPTAECATALMMAGGLFVLFGAKRKFQRLAASA
jgi:hypothetical protein